MVVSGGVRGLCRCWSADADTRPPGTDHDARAGCGMLGDDVEIAWSFGGDANQPCGRRPHAGGPRVADQSRFTSTQ